MAQGVGADLAGEAGLHGKAVQDVETVVSGKATPVPIYEEIVLGKSGAALREPGPDVLCGFCSKEPLRPSNASGPAARTRHIASSSGTRGSVFGTFIVSPESGFSASRSASTHQRKRARSLLKCRCAVVGRTRSRRVLRDRWTANAVQPATVRDKRNASMAAERVSAPPPDSPWDASERSNARGA